MSERPSTHCMSPSAYSLREARLSDLKGLLWLESGFPEADRLSRASLRRFVKKPDTVHIIEGSDGLVGTLILLRRKGSQTLRIYSLIIAPEQRGRGLAGRLLDRAEQVARDAECDRIRLEVREGNSAAQSIYARRGFCVTGRRPAFYGDGEAAHIMTKILA